MSAGSVSGSVKTENVNEIQSRGHAHVTYVDTRVKPVKPGLCYEPSVLNVKWKKEEMKKSELGLSSRVWMLSLSPALVAHTAAAPRL